MDAPPDTIRKGISRRGFLRAMPAVVLAASTRAGAAPAPLRIGLTPVFLDDQIRFTGAWRRWLAQRLDRPVVFVQRGNYREIVDLVLSGKLDCAWVCGFPYVMHRAQMRLVAVPLWQGQPLYQSYLIVARDATHLRQLGDLRGRVFAYSDPDSNSGFLYPQYLLRSMGADPGAFFLRTFFTWAHRNVVQAVNAGLADGGAVDGYVWERLAEARPALTHGTRIIDRSPPLGFPPFVARRDLPQADYAALREALLGMAADPEGAGLLGRLGLDGFVSASPDLFDGIARMVDRVRPA